MCPLTASYPARATSMVSVFHYVSSIAAIQTDKTVWGFATTITAATRVSCDRCGEHGGAWQTLIYTPVEAWWRSKCIIPSATTARTIKAHVTRTSESDFFF